MSPIPPSSTPAYTPTVMVTETVIPSETPTITPSATETELPFFTPTSTETETATPTTTSTSTSEPMASPDPLTFPSRDDWDAGILAFSQGAEGEWDHILWGGFANSLIEKGDTYYLYYQGSSYYDEQCESVSGRAIGVATSTDGIHWVKSAKNPVIRWSTSHGSIEEGAVSSAAWLGADGRIYIYYGANSGTGCNVNASARLAVSDDGENFQDVGEVLSSTDPGVWGYGDEIFPIGVYSSNEQWGLYYTPNGVALSRKLGLALGNSSTTFTQSLGVNDATVPAWGPVSVVLDGANSLLMTNPGREMNGIDLYRFDVNNPSVMQLLDSYEIPNCYQPSFLYDATAIRWMAACRDQNAENYFIIFAAP